MADGKYMRFSLPEGGIVMMQWPDDISLESLEMVEEMVALQLKSVKRAIQRRKEAASSAIPAQPAKEETK